MQGLFTLIFEVKLQLHPNRNNFQISYFKVHFRSIWLHSQRFFIKKVMSIQNFITRNHAIESTKNMSFLTITTLSTLKDIFDSHAKKKKPSITCIGGFDPATYQMIEEFQKLTSSCISTSISIRIGSKSIPSLFNQANHAHNQFHPPLNHLL